MSIHDKTFRTGDNVLANGMYDIFHVQHPLACQVALFKGEQFPKCSRCDSPVTFLLQRDVPALDYINNLEIRVPLTELEPIEHDDSTIGVISMDRDSA
jgi:hypothetical protein